MTYQEWKNAHAFRLPASALETLDAIVGTEVVQPVATKPGATTLNPAECVAKGTTYVAMERVGCDGCASINVPGISCDDLAECGSTHRPDKKSIVWVAKGAA